MDAFIPYLAQLGLPGLVLVLVFFLLKDDLRALIRRGPADTEKLIVAVERLTSAVESQSRHFEDNNGLFEQVILETRAVNKAIEDQTTRVCHSIEAGSIDVKASVIGVKEEIIRNGNADRRSGRPDT